MSALFAAIDERTEGYEPRQAGALYAATREPVASIAVQILGDSTGNETDEWVHLTAQAVAVVAPDYEVRHLVWDSTNQRMPRPWIIQNPPTQAHDTSITRGVPSSSPRGPRPR